MTELVYQSDTYQFECPARVREIQSSGEKLRIILDRTIFYPQGGGQPTDTGCIKSRDGLKVFNVAFARLLPDTGIVEHEGTISTGGEPFGAAEEVLLQVDKDRRILNSRLHSAGHLLDHAIQLLGIPLVGTKGYHFPDGPYVEYAPQGEVDLSKSALERLQSQIEIKAREMIDECRSITVTRLKPGECSPELYSTLPEKARQSEEVRLVRFENVPLEGPCGGTHLTNTRDIGKFGIRKVSQKKGLVKISYFVE